MAGTLSSVASGVSERSESELEPDDISTKLERSNSRGGVEARLGSDMTGKETDQNSAGLLLHSEASTDHNVIDQIHDVTAIPRGSKFNLTAQHANEATRDRRAAFEVEQI
jgi:hypothetical protein